MRGLIALGTLVLLVGASVPLASAVYTSVGSKQSTDGTIGHSSMWKVAPWAPEAVLNQVTLRIVNWWISPATGPAIPKSSM